VSVPDSWREPPSSARGSTRWSRLWSACSSAGCWRATSRRCAKGLRTLS